LRHNEIVRAAIILVLADNGRSAPALSDDVPLGAGGLGLDSLDLATIVARLDAELGIDPFASGSHAFRTVGEFIALYEAGERK
jgi:acyl carrier protein